MAFEEACIFAVFYSKLVSFKQGRVLLQVEFFECDIFHDIIFRRDENLSEFNFFLYRGKTSSASQHDGETCSNEKQPDFKSARDIKFAKKYRADC